MTKLTAREKKILNQVLLGMRSKDIAARESCKVSTIKFHLTHIYRKLGVTNRSALLAQGRANALALTTGEAEIELKKINLPVEFNRRFDVIVAKKHNRTYMFKSQRQFSLYMNISSRIFHKALAARRINGYSISILKGCPYE